MTHPDSLPRLERSFYQADAAVFWTLTTFDRKRGWLDDTLHLRFRELMVHAGARENLLCAAYVLMPDHLHIVWLGLRKDSDQLNAMAFLRTHLSRMIRPLKWQLQPFDHVLTDKERMKNGFQATCAYILQNPVRAELCPAPSAWKYSGCVLPGYFDMNPLDPKFWTRFWQIFQQRRDPACDTHIRMRPALPAKASKPSPAPSSPSVDAYPKTA